MLQSVDRDRALRDLRLVVAGLSLTGLVGGVMMFRNQTRRGIRAVQAGRDSTGLYRDPDAVIPTYCNDTVLHMPPDADPAMDRQRMRETGRRLADGYLRDPPLLASKEIEATAAG